MRPLLTLAAAALALHPGAASAEGWLSLQTNHFQIVGNAGGRELRDVALRLEQFREVMGELNPAIVREGNAPPVAVLVFRDRKSHEPFWPRAKGKPVQVGGLFIGKPDINYISLNLAAGDGAYPTVFHELTHLLVRGVFENPPVWFNEGLAEYYRSFRVSDNGRKAEIGLPIPDHVNLLRERRLPLAQFFAIQPGSREYTEDIPERSVLYAQSWAIVHHAFHGPPKRREQLVAFLTKIAGGGEMDASFREAYGMELGDLEKEVHQYIENRTYNHRTVELAESVVTRIQPAAAPISDAEGMAWLADLLVHMDREVDARPYAEKALAADPGVARAHLALGQILIHERQDDEGLAQLKRAAGLASTDEVAQFAYGSAVLRRRRHDRAAVTDASRALERAVELRPAYTEAKLLLANAYRELDEHEKIRDLLMPVMAAEPTNHDVGLRVADALLSLEDFTEARSLLGRILAHSTSSTERERARSLLAVSTRMEQRRDTLKEAGRARTNTSPFGPAAPDRSPPSSTPSEPTPVFRRVRPEEQRTYGVFEAMECVQNSIFVVVRTADGIVRAQAGKPTDIEFTAFRPLETMSVACGPQKPAMEVYLTWREAAGAGNPPRRTAVAIEILPEGFTP